jgi:lipopolysaccharide export system protein LptC
MVDITSTIVGPSPYLGYGGDREAAFVAAARHSTLVRFLRVAILASAVGAIAVFVVIAFFDPFGRAPAEISVEGVALDGTRVMMDRPRLAGFRKDGRPYQVTADRAIQDVLHPTIVELRGVHAEVGIAANGVSKVTAAKGVYDSATEHMDLSGDVHVKSDQYDVLLQSASIDFKAGAYRSNEPVNVVMSSGATINADTVAAVDNGRELIFEGRVRSVLQVGDAPARTSAELKGTDP